jgi:hypothetical protein
MSPNHTARRRIRRERNQPAADHQQRCNAVSTVSQAESRHAADEAIAAEGEAATAPGQSTCDGDFAPMTASASATSEARNRSPRKTAELR